MGDAENRAAIKATLEGVSNVGKVHDYDRWAKDWSKFIELFRDSDSGRILGWEITRRSASEDASNVRGHIYVIRGYMGLNDADETEKTFNSLVDDIAAAFRDDLTLNGGVLGHDFIQVTTLDARTFGAVLCHYAELQITVYEHET